MNSVEIDSQNWLRLQELFHAVAEEPKQTRAVRLKTICNDAEVRQRVLQLLEASDTEPEQPRENAEVLHGRVGPYRLVRHLDTGGIGSVYLAERMVGGALQRTALKVLAQHAAGASFVERFHREQSILATLEHPNITRLLDAGLNETGQPYLVMEYVNGVHLDQHCDTHKLTIEQRLELFLKVCDAVAYAHRNLVVHLDLKPSNILVTEDGTVKLLDFGTSKLIEPDSMMTTTLMATPAYASPEQLRNEAVTTASDVYALGSVLFELLSGQRPNGNATIALLIERAVREQEPHSLADAGTADAAVLRGVTAARLHVLLRGDLRAIVAKCLRSRARDRYLSVDSLMMDVRRYLAGRTVTVRRQTTVYRTGKFLRRNRALVAVALLVILLLAGALGYAGWKRQQAYEEGQRALRMQAFMVKLFQLANHNYLGKPAATVPELLQLGVRLLPQFIPEDADRRAALLSLSESMIANGDYQAASENLRSVSEGARQAHDIPTQAVAETELGHTEMMLGHQADALTLTADALALAHKPGITPAQRIRIEEEYAYDREQASFGSAQTLQLMQQAVDESRRTHQPAHDQATQLNQLGLSLQRRGDLQQADALFRESLALYQHVPYSTCDEALVYRYLGHSKSQQQDYAGSVALYRQAYARIVPCAGEDSLEALALQGYIANNMVKAGHAVEVVSMLEAALPRWRARVGNDSAEMATPLLFLTRAYNASGQFDKAEPTARELLRVLAGRMNQRSATMGVCQEVLAQALAGQHRYPEALAHAHAAIAAFPDHLNPGETANLAKARKTLADIERQSAQAR